MEIKKLLLIIIVVCIEDGQFQLTTKSPLYQQSSLQLNLPWLHKKPPKFKIPSLNLERRFKLAGGYDKFPLITKSPLYQKSPLQLNIPSLHKKPPKIKIPSLNLGRRFKLTGGYDKFGPHLDLNRDFRNGIGGIKAYKNGIGAYYKSRNNNFKANLNLHRSGGGGGSGRRNGLSAAFKLSYAFRKRRDLAIESISSLPCDFNYFDIDADGYIKEEELEIKLSKQYFFDAFAIFKAMDENADGRVTIEEFLKTAKELADDIHFPECMSEST